jgi:GT2 family glycosyltransferase
VFNPTKISVVIPTCNRRERLRETLLALANQSVEGDQFQVIVVPNGCTDGTAEFIESLPFPMPVTVLSQPVAGRAKARNAGARAASADIVLFLDDDMEAAPELLRAHLDAHQGSPDTAVIGYFPVANRGAEQTILDEAAQRWWNKVFANLGEPDHEFTFRDFSTGNVSIPRSLFLAQGGFDETLDQNSSGEDWELGFRLIQRGVRFKYARNAMALHHDPASLAKVLRRSRQEGRGHAFIVGRHPELLGEFHLGRLARYHVPRSLRPFSRLLWKYPQLIAPLTLPLRLLHDIAFHLNRSNAMWKFHGLLVGIAYWRGVSTVFRSIQEWEEFCRSVTASEAGAKPAIYERSGDAA